MTKVVGQIILRNYKHKYLVANSIYYKIPDKYNYVIVDNYYTCIVCNKRKEVISIIEV